MAGLATLYTGQVWHVRHTPFQHKFRYRIWMLAVELDALDALDRASWLFAHNRAGWLSIHDKDHGFRDGRPLRAYVEDALAFRNLQEFDTKILFITMPRWLGFAFNPISFYYCYNQAGRLGAVVHQVKNTFGGQVAYVMPVAESSPIRQSAPKAMHVSPFFDMAGGYRFALTAPGEKLGMTIKYGTATEKRMTAAMQLTAQPWSNRAALGVLTAMPATALKVILAIHWQALKLFIRGAKYHGIPEATNEAVIAGEAI